MCFSINKPETTEGEEMRKELEGGVVRGLRKGGEVVIEREERGGDGECFFFFFFFFFLFIFLYFFFFSFF